MNQRLLDEIVAQCRPLAARGKVASYIPELSYADPGKMGICIATNDDICESGDSRDKFTIQSISKILSFTCCLKDSDIEDVQRLVSFEPTSDGFASIVNLEVKNYNKPLNPMLNSGTIATLTLVKGRNPSEKFERVLNFARLLSGNPDIGINEKVYRSEKATGSRNRALAYFMKSTGLIDEDVEELLDAYFRCCAIEMNCADLARIALVYANGGEGHFSMEIARTVRAVMALCGMYNESGTVAVEIGVPSKSGVGGGILSVATNQKMGIGVYSPSLNEKGTSIAGLAAIKKLSATLGLNIF